MKRSIYLLFLILIACAPLTSFPTATPKPALTSIPVPSSAPANTPTPDAMHQAFDSLQAEGINVEYLVSNADGGWRLIINGVSVPGASFDESGKFLRIKTNIENFNIAWELAADRLQLDADGVLVLNDENGKGIAMFDPANPEAGWVEVKKEFPVCDADHFRDCLLSVDDLGVDGDYAKWAKSQLKGLALPEPAPDKVKAIGDTSMFLYLGLSDKDIPIEDRPFLAGFTFGFIKVDFVTNNGNKLPMDAAVVPIAFSIPGSPGELEVINVLFIKAYGVSDEVFIERLNLLKEKGALRLSLIDERNVINPIADQNQANFPNRVSDLQKFHETRDPRRIKGIIFEGSFLTGR